MSEYVYIKFGVTPRGVKITVVFTVRRNAQGGLYQQKYLG